MSPLQVDPATLVSVAVQCRGWAESLAAPPPSTGFGSPPATAAAAAMVHAEFRSLAADLAGRMRATAAALDETARRQRAGDRESAAVLGGAPAVR